MKFEYFYKFGEDLKCTPLHPHLHDYTRFVFDIIMMYFLLKSDGIIKKLQQELQKKIDIDYLSARKIFANNISTLELFPYHSRTFKLNNELLRELDSCKLMKNYVDSLRLRAENDEILLICPRSASRWNYQSHMILKVLIKKAMQN